MIERPLRFCMITSFYPPYSFGGDGIFVQRLAGELVRGGHHVEIIHCRDAYFAAGGREPTCDDDGDRGPAVHRLKSRMGILSPLGSHQTGLPLFKSAKVRRILGTGFDVVHYHNISLLGPAILTYGDAIKLYTMHEYWWICPTHVLFKFNRRACVSRSCLWCALAYRRPPQWWRYTGLSSRAGKHVDAFIAPSRFSQEKHREAGFDFPMVRLPPFAPRDRGDSQSPQPPADRPQRMPYFLFAGRLEKLKGLQTLIPLFRAYEKAELWIAGSGTFECELQRLAAGAYRIRFLGNLSQDKLREAYSGAVAVIVPSLCYETFGQVIIEAFSRHTPALVRDLGALPEIIEESGGGLVYHTDEELTAAMDGLVANAAWRDELAESGYQAYLSKWTPEVHLKNYLTLIETIRRARGGSNPGRDRIGV